MNKEILEKYKIEFYTTKNGEKVINIKDRVSSYLYIWKVVSDIDSFLDDIDLCIDGNFSSVQDPYYNDSTLKQYGMLSESSLILSGESGENPLYISLFEFKELLLSWREYLLK